MAFILSEVGWSFRVRVVLVVVAVFLGQYFTGAILIWYASSLDFGRGRFRLSPNGIFLQYRKIPDMQSHVCSMIGLDRSNVSNRCSNPNAESVRVIWSYVLEKIMRQGGPFAGAYKSDRLEELIDMAVRLYPDGIPDRALKWRIPEGVSVLEYAPFLSKIFTRTAPTPISNLI